MNGNYTSKSTNTSTTNYVNEIPWTVAFSLQFLFSIIGNVLVLVIIYKDNRLKTTTNYLVANMAVSDLLAAIMLFPYLLVSINSDSQWLIRGDISNVMCKLFSFANDVCFIVSVGSCVFIAVDRYYAVAKPLYKPFLGKIKWIIAGIWLTTVALSSPYLFFHLTINNGTQLQCGVSPENVHSFKVYRYIVLLLTSGLGALLIIVIYTLTVYKLYRHNAPGLTSSAVRRRDQQNKKVLKMAVTIVALLYFCHGTWLTFIILSYEGEFDHLFPSSFSRVNVRYIFLLMLCLSLMYNFLIYLVFNEIYRDNIKSMMCKCSLHQINDRNMEAVSRPTVVEAIEINTITKNNDVPPM